MRTTITLADDVAAAIEQMRRERGTGLSESVNELVRRGLATPEAAGRFTQRTSDMGQALLPLDDVAGLLDAIDGPA